MNLVALIGSPRKGKATETLVDKAIESVATNNPNCCVKKFNLSDYNIAYCKNCLACRDAQTDAPISKCIMNDDMSLLYEYLLDSDALILGTPVHSGYPTALMMTFLERITWTFAKPEQSYLTVHGCPLPRSNKERKAVIIVTAGVVPPLYRWFCDSATRCIKGIVHESLNARTIGDLYAGDIEHRGVDYYFGKASRLGRMLA
jgi:multimeric flavodoxin WrbA